MTEDVLIAAEGGLARLRLNRPKVIHALNRSMCETMAAALAGWSRDPAVETVMLDHAEGRGFCAGGDIRLIAESGKGDGSAARAFFLSEYRLNHLLFSYAKPTLAVLDGVTMGGGVGIGLPCRYRVATERTVLAMPETGIGLFPDVGGGWHLARLPGRIGAFMALTGARLDGAECVALGLATHYVESAHLEPLKARIAAQPASVEAILDEAHQAPPPARIERNRESIDRLFASDRYEEVLAALEADPSEWAARERATLASKSPLSCKVSLRLLAEGRSRPDFADEMRTEYRVASRICRTHDFIEGVRALLVDKDNRPHWQPATAVEVTDALVDGLFAPMEDGAEWSPFPPGD